VAAIRADREGAHTDTAQSLDQTGRHELAWCLRQTTEHRGQGEGGHADQEHASIAEQVAETPAGDEASGVSKGIAATGPACR
jgi:hypothetical protein